MRLILLLVCVCLTNTAQYIHGSYWTRINDFDDYVAQYGLIEQFTVRSRHVCCSTCSMNNLCQSFFYTKQSGSCRFHGVKLDIGVVALINQSTTTYYVKNEEFRCPAQNDRYRILTLSDGTPLTYKVFQTGTVDQETATAACNADGASLIRIYTLAKMQAVSNLTRCPGVAGYDYWIDGSNLGPTSDWRTSDQIVLPMTQGDFWYPNRPNFDTHHHCLRISASKDYLIDNTDCGRTDFNFICEKY